MLVTHLQVSDASIVELSVRILEHRLENQRRHSPRFSGRTSASAEEGIPNREFHLTGADSPLRFF